MMIPRESSCDIHVNHGVILNNLSMLGARVFVA